MLSFRLAYPSDWNVVRELRLRALKTDPDAFTSTYESKAAKPESYWKEQVADPNSNHSWMIGHLNEEPFAIGGGYGIEGSWSLYGIWIDPAHRGGNYSKVLLAGIISLGIMRGYDRAVLLVEPENIAARKAYTKYGFVESELDIKEYKKDKSLRDLVFMTYQMIG